MPTRSDPDPLYVYLGNRDAVEVVDDPTHTPDEGEPLRKTRRPAPGKRCTTIIVPPGTPLMEALHTITVPTGVWQAHSDGTPAWVASTNPTLAAVLAEHWQCEVRDPDPDHQPSAAVREVTGDAA